MLLPMQIETEDWYERHQRRILRRMRPARPTQTRSQEKE
jgi:hypothetical protein